MESTPSIPTAYQEAFALGIEPEIRPQSGMPRKPPWLKVPFTHGETLFDLKADLREKRLYTVCEEAKCPNISECWNTGTATFMIMGDTCTRGCRFCAVKTGNPGGLLDLEEPQKVARSIRSMNLEYAVITMVDRDDLPDGGAEHVENVMKAVQEASPKTKIEILAGDFKAQDDCIERVVNAGRGLEVFAHNIETVRRLTPRVRDARAKYDQSLVTLKRAKEIRPQTFTKSAIMLGLGETYDEVLQAIKDLVDVGVEILTIGQYLQPTPKHLRVKRFVHPKEFDFWQQEAARLGIKAIASGPLVRSSYKASHLFPKET